MRSIVLRSLAARRLRSALTAVAVLLGVTMISGTYVLTDAIDRAFTQIFEGAAAGADAIVSGASVIDTNFTEPRTIPAEVIERIRALPQVEQAQGQVNAQAALVDEQGEVLGGGGSPTIAVSYLDEPFTGIDITEGEPPRGPGEVAIDERTAEREGLEIGERVRVATEQPVRPFEIVGLVRFGGVSLGGATFLVFDLAAAQTLFDKQDEVDFVSIAAAEGATPRQVVDAVAPLLPRGTVVRTADEQIESRVADIGEGLGFLTTGLLAFGYLAVFVGAFIIFNTFAITVAQRTREFALLRMLGASRRQVTWSVIAEGAIVGLLGAIAGLLLGLGFATAIQELFKAVGVELPSTDARLELRTIVVCLAVGIGVTLVSALPPALRAGRTSPMQALREGTAPPRRRRRRLGLAAAVALALGGATALSALLLVGGIPGAVRGLGGAASAIALVLGIALLAPRAVPPLARALGAPLEAATSLVGRLARENAARNPGRTAVTAAALMVGLALVLFVTVFAEGLRRSSDAVIDRTLAGDVSILNDDGFSLIPAGAVEAVAQVPGVRVATGMGIGEARLGAAGTRFVNGVDPAAVSAVYTFAWIEGGPGSLTALGGDGILLERAAAEAADAGVGDVVRATFPDGARRDYRVRGVYRDPTFLIGSVIARPAFAEAFGGERVQQAYAAFEPGADPDATLVAVRRALAAFPEARARSQTELKEENAALIDQALGLVGALLAMSVIVSLFGIVTTLSLSIHERTRELGLLRAVGMSRRQVRRMVRYESVITAAIGAAMGVVLGLFLAVLVTRALADEGIVFALPGVQVLAVVVAALLCGVAAAVLPARRAARLDVLRAIVSE